jgi:superfamily I DNA/RNA helicase
VKITGSAVKRLLSEWETYKREHTPRLYEHGDYVQEAINEGLVPDVDVLLIDEFQDLAPLEYKLYKQWRDSDRIDRIYISGDPNQSVYSFRGGTPKYFQGTDKDDTITLKESYRCPEEIARVGRSILNAHSKTDARGFDGKEPGGTVEWETYHGKDDLRDGVLSLADADSDGPGVMALTRTNRQLGKLADDLRKNGVPFQTLGSYTGAWTKAMRHIYELLSTLGDRDEYQRGEVRELFKALPDGQERRRDMGAVGGPSYKSGAVEGALSDYESVIEIVDDLRFGKGTKWRCDVLRNALDAPGDISPQDVQIGTIHTAKGLEAPNVLLFTNTTRRMERRYRRREGNAAEEHRVYYVGATRASERLALVEDYFGGPIAPPIDRVRSRGVI